MTDIAQNLENIRKRMATAATRAGRDPGAVQLVAVSKRVPLEFIRAAVACGQTVFGENYLQEAEKKIAALDPGLAWHLIGHLQSNKARQAARLFDVVETVDSIKLARLLDNHGRELNRVMDVYVQVNVGDEPQKWGIRPEEAEGLLVGMKEFQYIRVKGFMAMPPFFDDPEMARPCFRRLRLLVEDCRAKGFWSQDEKIELSMGMSNDFEVAIEEGATLVRVGSALFGSRE